MVEVDEARQRRVVAELGVAYQMWVMAEVGFFCVNFDLNFFFFGGSSFGFEFCYWFVLILGWIFFVGSWWWSWGLPWWWWKEVGFLLWVICEFMVVKVEDCRGDGGGVAMGFDG